MMKKILLGAALIGSLAFQVDAVKAKPGITKYITQPDGSKIEVKLVGDERFHYYTTLDNTPLLKDESGYLKVATDAQLESIRVNAKRNVQRKARPLAVSNEPWKGVGVYGEHFPCIGDQNPLIILVAFSDIPFTVENPHDYYSRFLNEEGFSDHSGTGSVRDYFLESSMGHFRPTFDVYGPVTVGSHETYGANDRYGDDKNPEGMVIDACKALDDEIDFSKYDTDGDGYVDNIYIIYAGQGEATYGADDTIWPHQWEIEASGKKLTLDGVKINNYGCCNEWDRFKPDGIGTFCHEFGHVLGLPDLYSYSTTKKNYIATPGDWDIMDSGSYNNDGRTPPVYSAFERNALGWIDLKVINNISEGSLNDIRTSNEAYILPVAGKSNEFFLFENRQQSGNDKYLPGHGMLVWHINYSASKWILNQVNDVASAQYVDIEEANNNPDNGSTRNMAGYPFPGTSKKTEISDTTTPNLTSWAGKNSGISISEIAENNGVISFKVNNAAGINDVEMDSDELYELFNLQGVKVIGTPSPGIYIRKADGKATKYIVK